MINSESTKGFMILERTKICKEYLNILRHTVKYIFPFFIQSIRNIRIFSEVLALASLTR